MHVNFFGKQCNEIKEATKCGIYQVGLALVMRRQMCGGGDTTIAFCADSSIRVLLLQEEEAVGDCLQMLFGFPFPFDELWNR